MILPSGAESTGAEVAATRERVKELSLPFGCGRVGGVHTDWG